MSQVRPKVKKEKRDREEDMMEEEKPTKKEGVLINFSKLQSNMLFKDVKGQRSGWFSKDLPVSFVMSGNGWLKKPKEGKESDLMLMMQFNAPVTGGATSLIEVSDIIKDGYTKAFGDIKLHTPYWYSPDKKFMYAQFKLNGSGEIRISMTPMVEDDKKKSTLKDRKNALFAQATTEELLTRIGDKGIRNEIEIKVNFLGANCWLDGTQFNESDEPNTLGVITKLASVTVKRSWVYRQEDSVPEKIIEC